MCNLLKFERWFESCYFVRNNILDIRSAEAASNSNITHNRSATRITQNEALVDLGKS